MAPQSCYCINPTCPNPGDRSNNIPSNNFCIHCGCPLLLNKKYRSSRLLSKDSGFGLVFEVFNGFDVKILKILKPEWNNDQKIIEVFEREYKVLDQLTQRGLKGIPQSDDYFIYNHTFPKNGQTLQLYCLVMEKVEGMDLEHWINQHGIISQKYAFKWLKDIVLVLEEIHNLNCFHRDIKPPNIMMRNNGQLVLIDFGTAIEENPTYQANLKNKNVTRFNSQGYTPEEQIYGKAEKRSDFFALGRTFVHLLTGEYPINMYDSLSGELNWRDRTEDIDPPLLDFIDDLMQRIPKDRPANTRDILETLDEIEQNILQLQQQKKQLLPQLQSQVQQQFQQVQQLQSQSLGYQSRISQLELEISQKQQEFKKLHFQSQQRIYQLEQEISRLGTPKIGKIGSFSFKTVTVNDKGIIIKTQDFTAENWVFDLGNNVFLEMVKIPGGTFIMGSPSDEKNRNDNEGAQHTVTIAGFYMGKYPVTQAQYQQIMGENPSSFKKGGNYPVENVTWHKCKEFSQKLSQKLSINFSLPSEAQWEYACRAGTTTAFHFGPTITTQLANYDGSSTYANEPTGIYLAETTQVDKYLYPNKFGLYDMHGNVWEWCEDDYHENYNNAPVNGEAWLINKSQYSDVAIFRGGGWDYVPRDCRGANRYWRRRGHKRSLNGFRLSGPFWVQG